MTDEQKAREVVREYLARCETVESDSSEDDAIALMRFFSTYRGPLSTLISMAETDRDAWLACLWLLKNTDETPPGEVGFVSDAEKLDPTFRAELQRWAYRALTGQIRMPARRGRPGMPLRDHAVVMAVYKATLCGLPAFSSGNTTRLTACALVGDEIGRSPDAVKSIWQNRPKPRGE